MKKVVVIGAGIGGLSAGAVLAREGFEVTVLEAHVYPGGCAGTFFHRGYRFDAGATLAGGFNPGGPMDLLARSAGIGEWPGRAASPAMVVHLPDGEQVRRWGDERRWDAYREAFGEDSLGFWRWQESTAGALWDLAVRGPAWPPQKLRDFRNLTGKGLGWLRYPGAGRVEQLPRLGFDAFRPLGAHLWGTSEKMKLFVDGQLLISAQAESDETNALYGAAALDLPSSGVMHLKGGMGTISNLLVQSIRRQGGQVVFRQEASQIRMERGRPSAVDTRQGESFEADMVVANLTPWNVRKLVGEPAGSKLPSLRRIPDRPPKKWGAFVVYLGMDGREIPAELPLHHQVILSRPAGEGNTVFLSLSPEWDETRAPAVKRALTISTHTELDRWWNLYQDDPTAYKALQARYTDSLLCAAEKVIPGLREAAELILPGTPLTFQRFTMRSMGWVGGFQQTSLVRNLGARLGRNLWLVGDSIFPGQSVAAAALGGMRVAGTILEEHKIPAPEWDVQLKEAR